MMRVGKMFAVIAMLTAFWGLSSSGTENLGKGFFHLGKKGFRLRRKKPVPLRRMVVKGSSISSN